MDPKIATEKIYGYVYAPRKFQGTKWPGSERAGERKDQGANWPGSYWPIRSSECIGPGAKRLGTILVLGPICMPISVLGHFTSVLGTEMTEPDRSPAKSEWSSQIKGQPPIFVVVVDLCYCLLSAE